MKTHLKLVAPCNENRQVEAMPRRPANAELRSREYLTPAEIEKLIKAAKEGRWGHRDATLIMVAYRHGLRAKEACELEWSQVEFGRSAALHVRRAKQGSRSPDPGRRTAHAHGPAQGATGQWLCVHERTWHAVHARCHQPPGEDHRPARRPTAARPLPHASALVRLQAGQRWIDTRAIQDWLGHVSITHTTRYTAQPDQVQELLALEVVHPGSLSQTAMPGPANASCRSADRSRRGPAQSCSSSGAVDP